MNRIEGTPNQAKIAEAIRLMEVAALDSFKTVKAIKIGDDLLSYYFPELINSDLKTLEWNMDICGYVPIIVVDSVELSLVTTKE